MAFSFPGHVLGEDLVDAMDQMAMHPKDVKAEHIDDALFQRMTADPDPLPSGADA